MLPIEFSKITKKSPIPLDLIEDKNQRKASFYIKEFKKKNFYYLLPPILPRSCPLTEVSLYFHLYRRKSRWQKILCSEYKQLLKYLRKKHVTI